MEKLISSIIPKLKFKFPYSAEEYSRDLIIENYHCHKMDTNWRQIDCAESIENYAKTTRQYRGKCLFSGEHGSQGNVFLTYKTCDEQDGDMIKRIEKNVKKKLPNNMWFNFFVLDTKEKLKIYKKYENKISWFKRYNLEYRHSTEAYWVKDRLKEYPEIDKETGEYKKDLKTGEIKTHKDRTNCHIVLVAINNKGKEDINYALSLANENGYYYKPRLDLELLFQIPKENVIVTSACTFGWKYEDAEEIWLKIHNHFQDNFFLEVQNHNTEPQKEINKKILNMSKKYGIQIICGLDTHYITEDTKIKRDQILKYKGITYEEEQGWYLDFPNGKEIYERFKVQNILNDEEILMAMMNTNVFLVKCEKITFDKSFKIPSVYPNTTYDERVNIFKKILNDRYKNEKLKSKDKIKGIKYEVAQITESGVVDYFLTNDKIIDRAVNKKNGILTTTSRGSSASFITNKLLGFTTIDRFNSEIPIYPERFLTKERVLSGQMPDIDFNVASQEPFVSASRDLLGEHGCYPLLAVGKLKEKASWQLYAGANDVTPETANQISKYIDKYNEKLKYADEEDKEFIKIEDFIPEEYLGLYNKSLDYQGITIGAKVHACGHLLFNGDIRREIGLIRVESETTGNSVLCACIEGAYLDEFGYVKNDYLIVDSVHLTYEFFESINQKVPSFDELREMIKDDKATWDIYSKGITCCVNQCEKESTTKKAMQYKPQNLEELSAFIAGIRPGFKSLLSTFLAREKYTTGEKAIDDLLADSYHFMLYQESLMKLLSFLGVPMGDSYGTIKSISKKKLKGKKLEELQNTLKTNWNNMIKNLDNFDKIWQVFEDSARYAFNSPHALSMGGDSAYEAWFKAHHTTKFYEVAINHYQNKNKKDKIDALIKEAMIHFGYKLGDYEFGKDNRRVNIEGNIIYPNMSSIKGFGEKVSETLYELGKKEYKDFVKFLDSLNGSGINKTVLDKLIRLNYFKKFGNVNQLLDIVKWCDVFREAKEISQEKAIKLGLDLDMVCQYGNKTAKKITKLDSERLLQDIIINISDIPLTTKQIIDNQKDILGIITHIDGTYSNKVFYVSELEVMKSIVKVTLYKIKDGKSQEVKMWTSQYNKNSFNQGDFLYLEKVDKKLQKTPTGEINPETGKKIYRDVEGSFEFWLNRFKNVTYEFEEGEN